MAVGIARPGGARSALGLLTVRRAGADDFSAIRDIAWRSWEAAYGPFLPEPDRRAFFEGYYTPEGHRRAVENEGMLYLVAERDGTPAAFLLAREHARGVHLDRFYADPTHWRGGVGQRLWDELVAWARSRRARRVFFEVAADSGPGPAFYAKQGCKKRGEVMEPIGATPVRVARYVLDLAGR